MFQMPNPNTIRYTKLLLLNHMVAIATAGFLLMLGGDYWYRSESYKWTFELIPRRVWGFLFVVESVLLFLRPRAWTGALTATTLFMFGMTLLAAVLTGDSESLSGWIWATLIGANMFLWTAYGRFQQ